MPTGPRSLTGPGPETPPGPSTGPSPRPGPSSRSGPSSRVGVLGPVLACGLLGVLTGLLGTAVHLARVPVAGVLVPYGVLLAVALVVCTDVAVAAAATARRRPGPGVSLLAVAAGRGLVLGVLLLPSSEGDLVLTGLPASTAWILLAVVLPSFAAPMALALSARQRVRP
ncbi:hypothetical protein [Jannaschia sp. R86511]|uniref:hypothetical protein n=1 Tax=Jannaschia sp. R86511 TaxID=3093853 RepID=UPI0036D39663